MIDDDILEMNDLYENIPDYRLNVKFNKMSHKVRKFNVDDIDYIDYDELFEFAYLAKLIG